MAKRIIPGGVERYIHVFIPLLSTPGAPIWAIRSGNYNFDRMMLVQNVRVHGPSESKNLDSALSGTGGRGKAVMSTIHALEVEWDYPGEPVAVNTANATPEALAKAVQGILAQRQRPARKVA
jgi:hypothetical protein